MFTRSRLTSNFQQVSVSSYENRRFFMKTERVHTKNWITNEAEETLNTYDDYGNVTETTLNKGASNDFDITNTLETAISLTTYGTYAGAPYPGFPTSTTVQNTRVGQPQVSRTAGFVGAGVGNLAAGGSFFGNAAAQTVGFWAGAASGAAGGASGGFIGAAGNAWLGGANLSQGIKAGLKGAVIGGVLGGISNGITSEVRKATIERAGKIEATDAFLKKAQKTWYPDAPMDKVNNFTVENLSEKAQKYFKDPISAFTDPELTSNALLTGNSSVYFNPNVAFENSKSLYFTMGHELLHVSQISILAGQSLSYVNQSLRQMMEFQGYNYEAYLGRRVTLNSFTDLERLSFVQDQWFSKLSFTSQPWLLLSKYKYKYIW